MQCSNFPSVIFLFCREFPSKNQFIEAAPARALSKAEGKKFVSTDGAYRPNRNGGNHPYRDSTHDPDRDNNHPCHDVQSTRSGLKSRTIQPLAILIFCRSLNYLLDY
jgi:hypothetical protein